jgi:FMNH2-dependent dimethyl sulfone monooxygenase
MTTGLVQDYEAMGITHLLIPQRWWGSGEDIEGSSLDCLAMTALFAGCTERIQLVTAIHPGFFEPTAVAKWGATLDRITNGRWAINVTSGWNMDEFDMYGIDKLSHVDRYARSAEFIEVLRGAWDHETFDHHGRFYQAAGLHMEPRPQHPLTVFQGGQSDAAINMAATHSDWMFLNGGSPQKIAGIIAKVREATRHTGRKVRFAMYAAPLCRSTDDEAWQQIDEWLAKVDPELIEKRRGRTAGAEGMWADDDDLLALIDSNEGYAAKLVGSPDTVADRIRTFHDLGIDLLHLDLRDELFREAVLPAVHSL